MFHVLVAEDEIWIRNGIVEMIERFGLDFKVVAQASDGIEAWNQINEVWPNVVITDIVMPELDGLSLLGKCDEYKLGIVPIVISGYENFAYAQQAIRYGATEYLLKPVVAEDLKQALLRSVERLQSSVHLYDPLYKIQEFLGVMEVWDHQRLAGEANRILSSIYKAKVPHPGIRNGLLRIFSDKLNEQLRGIDPFHQHLQLGDPSDKLAVQAHFTHLLEQWSRQLNAASSGHRKRFLSKRVTEYVEQNYAKEITLAQIAEYTDLSVSRFCVLFKQQYGDSFINHLNKYRIEKAKQLLLEPDLKVYEVADMVGFSSMPYFNRLFKSLTDRSPGEYRRSLGL
ncbi:helix-turn-helix domain-containing protein [Paenibacillus sp. FSL W7-1332]|uniref:helix-turn-helix domain-containing protein n=1 Tax=Paenibacillus sp. FSL W7-1332 TaxID=2921702 RepID=UPI0030D4980D